MIISPHGFWLVGKSTDILSCLTELAQQYEYVADMLDAYNGLIPTVAARQP